MTSLLTHSSLQTFKTCPRKYYFKYIRGFMKDTQSKPLRMGSACHKVKEHIRNGMPVENALALALKAYEVVPLNVSPEDWAIERETVYRLMLAHVNLYSQDGVKTIAAEMQFELPIRHPETGSMTPKYKRGGKIDGIIELQDKREALEETKTTSSDISSGADYWLRLGIDEQVTGYFWAARQMGHDVTTIIYDVIRKPTIAPKQIPLLDENGLKIVLDTEGQRVFLAPTKKGELRPRQSADKDSGWTLQTRVETPTEFGDRLSQDIIERPEFYFARRELSRLEADLAEFENEQWQTQRSLSECERNGRWYRNTAACLKPYRCEFADACFNGFCGAEGQTLPAGYKVVENVHPELNEEEISE